MEGDVVPEIAVSDVKSGVNISLSVAGVLHEAGSKLGGPKVLQSVFIGQTATTTALGVIDWCIFLTILYLTL